MNRVIYTQEEGYALGSGTYSNPFVRFAFDVGMAALGLTLILMLLIIIVRLAQVRKEKHTVRFLTKWRPLFMQSIQAIPPGLPSVRRSEWFAFMSLWIQLHESLLGEAKERLNELARRCGMHKVAMRMLERRGVRDRLLAVAALGHLREKSAWMPLVQLASGENSLLALAAARAIVQIDPQVATTLVVPLIMKRTDWSPGRISAILKEAGADVVSRPLCNAIHRASPGQALRLIRYLDVVHSDLAMKTLGEIIERTKDENVIAACLEVMKDPRVVHLVRACLYHRNWHIRMQAAAALGRIGSAEDEQDLVRLLADQEWWVRYAAAEALVGLPFIGSERLRQIETEHTEELAKEILRHVIAEREIS